MAHLALYRKYRPTTFEDLLGQELSVRILKEASRQGKLAHAYLFAGPRGTGKTTTARLIAKVANCEKRQNDSAFAGKGEPCNECPRCVEIDGGHSLDVIEIDAASNRGIDEIRNLRESIRVTPATSKAKVYIIDEAHQLTKDAANALLKTLEEPPEHAILILATTEPEKLPPTIISRTQQFYFTHVTTPQIVKKLLRIAKSEKLEIAPDALELIASSAEGSFRDAESLLDQLMALTEKQIVLEDVEKAIGKVGFEKLSLLAHALITNKLGEALETLDEIENSGYDVTRLTKDLIQYLRRVAVLKANPNMKKYFKDELTAEHLSKLESDSSHFTETHLRLLKELIAAYGLMRYSQFPIIPLQVTIIEALQKK